MSESYQDQTELEKPRECFGWSLKKSFNRKHEGTFVKSIKEHCNPGDDLPLKEEKR